MSPASEVERYIGACLFSRKPSPKSSSGYHHGHHHHQTQYYPQNGYGSCPWGGAPLISFHHNQLAGAPLIVTKSYNHRKNKPQRNNVVQQTKVFENSNHNNNNNNKGGKGVDSVSVTSDESSSSHNSETCLPRIIKPRKRRKKDRKPPSSFTPHYIMSDEFSLSSSNDPASSFLAFQDLEAEAPKLHHSFDEVEEFSDGNVGQPVSTCQCRYCDPEGQIWDVDRSCYSPFLTRPSSFPSSITAGLSSLTLGNDDTTCKPSFSRSSSTSFSRSSSTSSSGDLEVSTEIVTSLNGHRDLEIKFWLSGAVDSKN